MTRGTRVECGEWQGPWLCSPGWLDVPGTRITALRTQAAGFISLLAIQQYHITLRSKRRTCFANC